MADQVQNGSGTVPRSEYTLAELKAAVVVVNEAFDLAVFAPGRWISEEDRDAVMSHLHDRIGTMAAAVGLGVDIGLQMAEARRDDR